MRSELMNRAAQKLNSRILKGIMPQWTRVNLNSNRTDPCAGLCDVRQVPARPNPMQARFQL